MENGLNQDSKFGFCSQFSCIHCDRLKVSFEEAAKVLANGYLVPLGRIDCTDDLTLKIRYNLTGFPALRVFRNGFASKFTGDADGRGINLFY